MTSTSYPPNALVFRFDDQQDGSCRVVAVYSEKCLLGFPTESFRQSNRCALVRGKQGVALRSLGEEIAVNGTPSTVHWIQSGDKIEFTGSISAIVEQLGSWQQELEHLESPEPLVPSLSTDATSKIEETICQPPSGEETPDSLQVDDAHQMMVEVAEVIQATQCEKEEAEPLSPVSPATDLQAEIRDEIASVFASLNVSSENTSQVQDTTHEEVEESIVGYEPACEVEEPAEVVQVQQVDELPLQAPEQEPPFNLTPTPNPMVLDTTDSTTLGSQEESSPQVSTDVNDFRPSSLDTLDQLKEPSTAGTSVSAPADLASEPVGESIDSLTHSQLTDGSSLASSSLPTSSESLDVPTLDSASLLKELLATPADSKPEFDEPAQSVSPSSDSLEPAQEEAQDTPEDDASVENESVTDLLERMKREGQWNGIPDEDEPATSISEQPTPEPSVAPTPSPSSESENDVDSYMSDLLSRMRGGAKAPEAVAPIAPTKASKPKDASNETTEFEPPTNPLKPEEFVPKQKAKPIQSLNAMRELANTTARTAVKRCEKDRRKALGHIQIAIGVISFVMSLYYLFWESAGSGDISFFVGMICLIIAGFLAFRFYQTMVHNEQIEAAELSKKLAKEKQQQNSDAQPETAQPQA